MYFAWSPGVPALQSGAFSEILLALVCTSYQAAWPLICSFSPLHLCTRLSPAWPTPNSPPISNIKLYELLLPTTLHTGHAVRGSCFKSVIFCRLSSLRGLHPHLSSSTKWGWELYLPRWVVVRIKWDNAYKALTQYLKLWKSSISVSHHYLITPPSARHKTQHLVVTL